MSILYHILIFITKLTLDSIYIDGDPYTKRFAPPNDRIGSLERDNWRRL